MTSPLNEKSSVHQFYHFNRFSKGYGMCIHTYQDNGDPIPSFIGEPYLVPLQDTNQEIAENYYNALKPEYRISLVVKSIDVQTESIEYYIINKHKRKE